MEVKPATYLQQAIDILEIVIEPLEILGQVRKAGQLSLIKSQLKLAE